jgi:hypothetical protein
MSIQEAIREIIERVGPGEVFDSHIVIDLLIRDYSDEYLRFMARFSDAPQPTFTGHQHIGQEIARFSPELVKRQGSQGRSRTIHDTLGPCASWLRV